MAWKGFGGWDKLSKGERKRREHIARKSGGKQARKPKEPTYQEIADANRRKLEGK